MIAHEKAMQLISDFKAILLDEDTDCGNEILCTLIAKKCALVAVQNIIDNNPHSFNYFQFYPTENYWQVVKKEIEEF